MSVGCTRGFFAYGEIPTLGVTSAFLFFTMRSMRVADGYAIYSSSLPCHAALLSPKYKQAMPRGPKTLCACTQHMQTYLLLFAAECVSITERLKVEKGTSKGADLAEREPSE